MDKYIYDNNNGLWYELQSDYYMPCLTIPEEEKHPIGTWGGAGNGPTAFCNCSPCIRIIIS